MSRNRLGSALAMVAMAAILLPSTLTAQITFQRTYGGTNTDWGNSVQQTRDFGYVVTGYTNSFGAGNADVYVIKTGASGDTLWTRTFGGAGADYGYSVQQTTDSGYIIAGYTNSFGAGNTDVYVIKTGVSGDTLWTKTYGGAGDDRGASVLQTTDSGYIIAGYTNSFGAGNTDVYVIKSDASGDTLWTKTYGGAYDDRGASVQQTTDSGYIFAGYTYSAGSLSDDVYLVKTDANGGTLWTSAFGGPSEDLGFSVRATLDSGYIVAGSTESFGTDGRDVWLVKTDADGDTLWTRTFGGNAVDFGACVQQTAGGGYIVAGLTHSYGAGYADVYVIGTDAAGITQWTKTFGGSGYDDGWSVEQTADGGYVIAGMTESFGAGGQDVFLIKTDSLGNVGVEEPRPGPTRMQAISMTCEPNPCRGMTAITLKPQASSSEPVTLRVYDASGCLVHSASGIRTSPFRLDLRTLPAGAYFIRVDAGSEHAAARIVLQR